MRPDSRTRSDAASFLSPDALAETRLPLERAATLPSHAYTCPSVWEVERERVLAGSWLCAGRLDQIPEPGDYVCVDLLGDKLVLVRDQVGVPRVLSRICRHRAAEVASGTGRSRSFQCPYHAWTYRLDGSLIGSPLMNEAEFDRGACRLPEIRSEIWEGFVFVNFDGKAAPLESDLAPLAAYLAPYRMSELVAIETGRYESPFNWKVLVDNFMEAYHHIATHRDTLEPIFPAALSRTRDEPGPFSVLEMPQGEDVPASHAPGGLPLVGPLDGPRQRRLVAAVVYPFHLFAPGPTSVAWYQLFPTSHDHFELRIYTCFPREALEDEGLREAVSDHQALVRHVHEQDIGACESTWAGLQARSYHAGRLAPLEEPLWRFNQWWIGQIGAEASRV